MTNRHEDTPAGAAGSSGMMQGLAQALRAPRTDEPTNESALVSLVAQLQHLNRNVDRIAAAVEHQAVDLNAIRQLLEQARDDARGAS